MMVNSVVMPGPAALCAGAQTVATGSIYFVFQRWLLLSPDGDISIGIIQIPDGFRAILFRSRCHVTKLVERVAH
jgi:hypothetical protein